MIINYFILKKIFFSIVITLLVILSVFFIFSLLGNLGENHSFQKILYFSLLSTIQIFFQIPILVMFVLFSIFYIEAKNNNELTILMHYISIKKFYILFLVIIILFTFIEINKKTIIDKIEDIKSNSVNDTSNLTKLIVYQTNNITEYILLKYNDDEIYNPNEISIFNLNKKNLISAIYSNNILYKDNSFFLNDYSELKGNKINIYTDKIFKFDDINFSLLKQKSSYIKGNIEINLFEYNQIIFFLIIFFTSNLIFVIFINRKAMVKNNNDNKYLLGLSIIFYMYFILNFKLNEYDLIFKILCLIFILSLILKKNKYE